MRRFNKESHIVVYCLNGIHEMDCLNSHPRKSRILIVMACTDRVGSIHLFSKIIPDLKKRRQLYCSSE